MISNQPIPQELEAAIGGQAKEFAVKAKRAKPFKRSIGLILFGLVWLGFSSMFAFIMFGPLLQGKEVNITINDVPTTVTPDNLAPLLIPGIFVGIFLLVGIGTLGYGIYSVTAEGPFIVGTKSALLIFRKGKLRTIDWEQFNGDITVSGDDQNGTVALQMRTGKMVSKGKHGKRYVPDVIHMAGIPNAYEIEQICRKHIKENDPTPASKSLMDENVKDL
jgi:hypothetical protein